MSTLFPAELRIEIKRSIAADDGKRADEGNGMQSTGHRECR
jgi:hypothetical protein